MPTYCYRVEGTDEIEEHYKPLAEGPKDFRGEDGRMRVHDIAATARGVNTQIPSCWPRKSVSMGVRPQDVERATRLNPKHEYTKTGEMILRSPGHAKQCAKDIGFADKG